MRCPAAWRIASAGEPTPEPMSSPRRGATAVFHPYLRRNQLNQDQKSGHVRGLSVHAAGLFHVKHDTGHVAQPGSGVDGMGHTTQGDTSHQARP